MEYHSGGSLPLLGRPRYCPGANANGGYLCETGHCCGETGCCTYYYELWWFWLLWTVLILFSCCCAYRHRRAKLRVQQQQRQREISLLAYHGANSYPSSMLDLSFLASLKLPSYEEVAAQPSTPPPPYSSVFTTPRYPQPPRTADPHLLTQHGPLLHRPHSDGPSSLSSDNSSSCSCDSCCPSSPCSSSLSAPITYETDTSHASTPSEATPLTLDVTMETISAAATCLKVNKAQFASERRALDVADANTTGAHAPVAINSSVPNQTVTVAVVTRAASPQPSPSPGFQLTLPVGTTSPIKQQLDIAPCTPIVSTCSSSTLPSPNVDTALPTIQIIHIEGPAKDMRDPDPKNPTPTASTSDSSITTTKTPETLNLTRTFDTVSSPNSPASVPSPDVGRTLSPVAGSTTGSPTPNSDLVPIPLPTKLTQSAVEEPTELTQSPVQEPTKLSQTPIQEPTKLIQSLETTNLIQGQELQTPLPKLTQPPDPVTSDLILLPNPQPKATVVADSSINALLSPVHTNLALVTDAAPTLPTLCQYQKLELSPGLGLVQVPPTPGSDLAQHLGSAAVSASCLDSTAETDHSGHSLILSRSSEFDHFPSLPLNAQAGFGSGSCSGSESCSGAGLGSGPLSTLTPVLTFSAEVSSTSSCPAITIESESSYATCQSPLASLSPSSSPPLSTSPPPPPPLILQALSSTSLAAPALLLDPLTALHQSDKGGSSSGHASSLSPSPRATQSPPKQTLFSPCVDVFEPGPPSWENEEEEQEEKDNDEDEDEDMEADESQYRHRRLTGDSGIEVCRCRVEEEDDEEEEEEEEGGRKGSGGERDKRSSDTDLHDSVDCPARGQVTTEEGLTLCTPTTTTTPTSEDSGEVVIVMETV
ncbi:flocculation protein FLO11-like [Archocentrus centrarchus]|uniref:flocculation protein FLO11-like n=1 Tax=Archocentrus centrarchus TaxID=63155 RepID=UPI0011E9E1E3|nr:flocculation protein FLO11-like [Archocentrus centrarchus]